MVDGVFISQYPVVSFTVSHEEKADGRESDGQLMDSLYFSFLLLLTLNFYTSAALQFGVSRLLFTFSECLRVIPAFKIKVAFAIFCLTALLSFTPLSDLLLFL